MTKSSDKRSLQRFPRIGCRKGRCRQLKDGAYIVKGTSLEDALLRLKRHIDWDHPILNLINTSFRPNRFAYGPSSLVGTKRLTRRKEWSGVDCATGSNVSPVRYPVRKFKRAGVAEQRKRD